MQPHTNSRGNFKSVFPYPIVHNCAQIGTNFNNMAELPYIPSVVLTMNAKTTRFVGLNDELRQKIFVLAMGRPGGPMNTAIVRRRDYGCGWAKFVTAQHVYNGFHDANLEIRCPLNLDDILGSNPHAEIFYAFTATYSRPTDKFWYKSVWEFGTMCVIDGKVSNFNTTTGDNEPGEYTASEILYLVQPKHQQVGTYREMAAKMGILYLDMHQKI